MVSFFKHFEPIWLFALWMPLFATYSFYMAFEEYTEIVDRSIFRTIAYFILGIVAVLATPLIIVAPYLENP